WGHPRTARASGRPATPNVLGLAGTVRAGEDVGPPPARSWTELAQDNSAGDGALRRGADQLDVLREHAAGGAQRRGRRHPPRATLGEYVGRHLNVEPPVGDVQDDGVTVLDQGDRTALGGLGRDVPDAQAGGAAGEPS